MEGARRWVVYSCNLLSCMAPPKSYNFVLMLIESSSNFEIITACSPNNFDLVKSLGADHVFDYTDANAAAEIAALTKDALPLCIDCFSEQSSYDFCSKTLSEGATYLCIGPVQPDRLDIDF
jgi:NADPH:quinone reductase-like Zn-dependent oxidoreductase